MFPYAINRGRCDKHLPPEIIGLPWIAMIIQEPKQIWSLLTAKDGPQQLWDVPAFECQSNEQLLRSECDRVKAVFCGTEVNPAFRYVVLATVDQMQRIKSQV